MSNGRAPQRRLRWAAALGVALLCGCSSAETGPEAAPEPAPDFELPTLDGRTVSLEAARGRTLVMDFWATWCDPCEVQMPVLDALWRERGGTSGDLLVVGISVDTRPPAEVDAWVRERGFGYPIALGDQDLAMRYGVLGFPTLIIIDPTGVIHTRHMGVLSGPELGEILDQIEQSPGSSG